MPAPIYSIALENKAVLNANTMQLGFRFQYDSDDLSQNNEQFSYKAGQFIQLLLDIDDKTHKRSYSIANSPEDFEKTGIIEIAISFVKGGLASRIFADADLGMTIKMTGPFGILVLPESLPGKLVLAGTGTGIAPYRAMIPDIQALAKSGTPVAIIAGFRHRQDQIYHNDFLQLDSIKYLTCLSRENISNLLPNENSGHVQEQFSSLALNHSCDLVYLCGNPGMIDDAANALKEMGFPSRQIKREKYVYSGH